jgi:hypothetical protein
VYLSEVIFIYVGHCKIFPRDYIDWTMMCGALKGLVFVQVQIAFRALVTFCLLACTSWRCDTTNIPYSSLRSSGT